MALSVALLLSAVALPCMARDMTGKGGIGIQRSSQAEMGNLPMLLFRYWGAKTGWEVLVGLDLVRDRSSSAVYFKSAPTKQVFMLDTAVPTADGPNATGTLTSADQIEHVEPWFFDTTNIFVGLGMHRMIFGSDHLSVTLGVRGVAQFSSTEDKARSETSKGQFSSALALLLEVPLQAEVFLSDHSSITASVGLSASVASKLSATGDKDGGLVDLLNAGGTDRGGMAFELGGRYSGGLGYTYYF